MIRKLQKEDIPAIAKIHKEYLPGFLSELGIDFLKLFYQATLDIPELYTLVEMDNEQIQGFVSVTTRPGGLFKSVLKKDYLRFIFTLSKIFITQPVKLVKTFRTFAYPGFKDDIPELTTIVVVKEAQKKGLGRKLFKEATEYLTGKGAEFFRISVYDRLPANKFYLKIGCRFEKSFPYMGEKMNYYIFKIKHKTVNSKQ
jgi:ribosomal protein S18 acetylase RimI-like enzyme